MNVEDTRRFAGRVRAGAAIASLLVLCAGAARAGEPPTKPARAAFEAYVDALSTKNGAAAAKVVTTSTFDYYERMRVAALEAPAKTVKQMGPADQIMVLALRLQLKPEQLRRMKSKDVFVEAINRGWIDSNMVARASLARLAVRGDVATGVLMKDDQDLHVEWHLTRENGQWKNDLFYLVQLVNMMLSTQSKVAGLDLNQLLQTGVESLVGRKLTPADWDPPASAGPK
jgi:hypothetical protein